MQTGGNPPKSPALFAVNPERFLSADVMLTAKQFFHGLKVTGPFYAARNTMPV